MTKDNFDNQNQAYRDTYFEGKLIIEIPIFFANTHLKFAKNRIRQ